MPSTFPELWERLEAVTPALFPTQPREAVISQEILYADLFPGQSGAEVELCRAGLLLWNDDLDSAHPIVQNIETPTGSFWHAIIHRREGDFSNARYWWRRTGAHPVFDEICDLVLHRVADFPFLDELRNAQGWEPIAFTDFCERAQTTGDNSGGLEEVQRLEMKVLLEWCASQVK